MVEAGMVRRGGLQIFVLVVGLLIAGSDRADALEKFSYGLSWVPEAEHCGFFQARETGLYRDAGLDVEIVPGGPNINLPQMVAAGKVDAGMGVGFTSLNMRNNNIPGITVAAMFQRSPQTLVAHPNRGIKTLEDLKSQRIAVANFSRLQFWLWLKAKYEFSDEQLKPYAYNPAAFVADPTSVQQGYITEDAFFLGKVLGAEPVSILMADYGYPDYATTVYTTESVVQGRPAVLQAFLDASIKGFAQCFSGDPTPAFRAIVAISPEQSMELSAFKVAQMKKFALVEGGDAVKLGIGAMTDARWKEIFDLMSEAGAYPKDLNYRSAYTLDFVNKKVALDMKK
jgi:NitT/TauT family transport system substrate-binding protein